MLDDKTKTIILHRTLIRYNLALNEARLAAARLDREMDFHELLQVPQVAEQAFYLEAFSEDLARLGVDLDELEGTAESDLHALDVLIHTLVRPEDDEDDDDDEQDDEDDVATVEDLAQSQAPVQSQIPDKCLGCGRSLCARCKVCHPCLNKKVEKLRGSEPN